MSARDTDLRPLAFVLGLSGLLGCAALEGLPTIGSGSSDPTSDEIARGLEEALSRGALEAVTTLGQEGGYAKAPQLRIPFPEEARFVADALGRIGLGSLVESFEERLNQGAEAGARRALPIFEGAIRQMSFEDVRQVLFGDEHAATDYFREHTFDALVAEFRPEIQKALGEVGAEQLWTELGAQYNRIPLVRTKVDTDIVHYATERALDGLFLELAREEARIRADPVARTTSLLRRVFGYAERSSG